MSDWLYFNGLEYESVFLDRALTNQRSSDGARNVGPALPKMGVCARER